MVNGKIGPEEQALALLSGADVAVELIQAIAKDSGLRDHPRVRVAVVQHVKTPRQTALNLLRKLRPLELMEVSMTPRAPAGIRHVAEQEIVKRLEGTSVGEKLTLARCGSGAIAAVLLHDSDHRIVEAALDNRRLTEGLILKVMGREDLSQDLIGRLSRHPNWSVRQEIRVTLLRHPATPLARILEHAQSLPHPVLQEVVRTTPFEENVRKYLERLAMS